MKRKYRVSNMMCASCVSHVKKAAESVKGVDLVEVNLLTETMSVIFDEQVTNDDEIISAVEKEGYGCKIFKREITLDDAKNLKFMKVRIIVSIVCMILLMFVSMSHMFNINLPFGLSKHENAIYFVIVQIVLLIPIVVLNNSYFVIGFKKLFTLKPNMDSLIAIGATASIAHGIYSTIMIIICTVNHDMEKLMTYQENLYFESAGTILTLITIGKFLESRSKKKTTESLEKIMALAPKTALVKKGNEIVELPVEKIMINDYIIVKSGMQVPVDGKIVKGNGSLNESIITGESLPIDKTVDDLVIAGSTNLNGYFEMQATSISGDTTVDRILDLVEEAASSKAPISRLADKIAAVFVPIVIGIAILSAIVWLIIGNKNMALNSFISVLVISCPCSLGLATPVAIMVATGKAAEYNILIKSAESLELSHSISSILLDKTGTITEGKMVVKKVESSMPNEEFLKTIAMIESNSLHPLSISILNYVKENKIDVISSDETTIIPGLGLEVVKDNIKYYAGNSKLMEQVGVKKSLDKITEDLSKQGMTVIYFTKENEYLGFVSLQDEIREDAPYFVKKLKEQNITPIMVTGDNYHTGKAIASLVGIDEVFTNCTPNEKSEIITKTKEKYNIVAFVGDGVNDAVALTVADVGIAIGTGSEVATSSADIILPNDDLMNIVTLISLSRKTINNIKMNLFWAFFYNAIGIFIATGALYAINVVLNPMIAALAMSLSSFCVVTNALRLRHFKPIRKE